MLKRGLISSKYFLLFFLSLLLLGCLKNKLPKDYDYIEIILVQTDSNKIVSKPDKEKQRALFNILKKSKRIPAFSVIKEALAEGEYIIKIYTSEDSFELLLFNSQNIFIQINDTFYENKEVYQFIKRLYSDN